MMNKLLGSFFVLVLVAAALAAGYYWGSSRAVQTVAAPEHTETHDAAPGGKGSRILYYRNAMGLPDTSPVPKKDAMGMDYVPVYAGDETPAGQVRISSGGLQKLGVRTAAVQVRAFPQTLRFVGTLQVDERRESTVNAKFEGWITDV